MRGAVRARQLGTLKERQGDMRAAFAAQGGAARKKLTERFNKTPHTRDGECGLTESSLCTLARTAFSSGASGVKPLCKRTF